MNLKILVVDDDKVNRTILTQRLNSEGCKAEAHESAFSALKALDESNWDVVLTDLCMPSMDGLQFLKEVKAHSPETQVILMTAFGDVTTAVEAMRNGAVDYLNKPFNFDELKIRLEHLAEHSSIRKEISVLRKAVGPQLNYCGMVGSSPEMRRVFELIERFADNPTNILIEGETGTGKEQVARALHQKSGNNNGPFVALSCANIPRELAESELFGHEAGSFTGAAKRRKGRIELAQGGTLFLDDVDDMPLELQGKLLRVIQERKFERVGGEQTLTADVRIISASKVDLSQQVKDGKFRDDLMYRLRVLVIPIPALRDRREDIVLLAKYFLSSLAQQRNVEPKSLSVDAIAQLMSYKWPGNVRELQHAMEYSLAMATGSEIRASDLPVHINVPVSVQAPFALFVEGLDHVDLRDLVNSFEQEIIKWALIRSNGNQGKAAKILGVPRTTLQSKLRSTSGRAADSSAEREAIEADHADYSAENAAIAAMSI